MATIFSFMNTHEFPSAIRFFIHVFLTLVEIPINVGRRDIPTEKSFFEIRHEWLKWNRATFYLSAYHLCLQKGGIWKFRFCFTFLSNRPTQEESGIEPWTCPSLLGLGAGRTNKDLWHLNSDSGSISFPNGLTAGFCRLMK